jgi:hypothetical protein
VLLEGDIDQLRRVLTPHNVNNVDGLGLTAGMWNVSKFVLRWAPT